MPDIQTAFKTALSRTLQQWDDDDGELVPQASPTISTTINNSVPQPSQNIQGIPMTQTFNITNNISRETFRYIKDNPGSTRKEIIAALEHRGFASGSVSSLIAQMRRNQLVHETNNLYYADADEYRPLKSLKAIKRMEAKAAPVEVKPKRKYTKRSEGIGALLKAKLESMPEPSQDALDAAAYAMGGQRRLDKPFLTKLVRTQSPESIVENMNVLQARELYDYLRKIFGG
jgi:hypothetical protein